MYKTKRLSFVCWILFSLLFSDLKNVLRLPTTALKYINRETRQRIALVLEKLASSYYNHAAISEMEILVNDSASIRKQIKYSPELMQMLLTKGDEWPDALVLGAYNILGATLNSGLEEPAASALELEEDDGRPDRCFSFQWVKQQIGCIIDEDGAFSVVKNYAGETFWYRFLHTECAACADRIMWLANESNDPRALSK